MNIGKSFGEKRVRVEFNPENNEVVHLIKQKTAELINLCQMLKEENFDNATPEKPADFEMHRLVHLAQTEYETAAMWAVKAATACKK
jgi:hypothetical protein